MVRLQNSNQIVPSLIKQAIADIDGLDFSVSLSSERLGASEMCITFLSNTVLRDHDEFMSTVTKRITDIFTQQANTALTLKAARKGKARINFPIPKGELSVLWDKDKCTPKNGYFNKYELTFIIERTR